MVYWCNQWQISLLSTLKVVVIDHLFLGIDGQFPGTLRSSKSARHIKSEHTLDGSVGTALSRILSLANLDRGQIDIVWFFRL
jgi:hypothetical protein